jgi:hypothetical protein
MKVSTRSRRAAAGLGTLVGVLLAAGAAAAVNVESSAHSPAQRVVVGAPVAEPMVTEPVPESTAVPDLVATTVPTTAAPTTTTARPATTTVPKVTAPMSPTTTAARVATAPVKTTPPATAATRPAFSMSPTSGPPRTAVTVSGRDCTGEQAGATIAVRDAGGQEVDGGGGAALPDGTWSYVLHIASALPAGPYTVHPRCINAATSAVYLTYEPQTLTVTA